MTSIRDRNLARTRRETPSPYRPTPLLRRLHICVVIPYIKVLTYLQYARRHQSPTQEPGMHDRGIHQDSTRDRRQGIQALKFTPPPFAKHSRPRLDPPKSNTPLTRIRFRYFNSVTMSHAGLGTCSRGQILNYVMCPSTMSRGIEHIEYRFAPPYCLLPQTDLWI